MRDVWIEMLHIKYNELKHRCHIPCGMCGLKFRIVAYSVRNISSHPMRDVWIEIAPPDKKAYQKSHIPCGMCGLKSLLAKSQVLSLMSHPMRDVWIEIRPC